MAAQSIWAGLAGTTTSGRRQGADAAGYTSCNVLRLRRPTRKIVIEIYLISGRLFAAEKRSSKKTKETKNIRSIKKIRGICRSLASTDSPTYRIADRVREERVPSPDELQGVLQLLPCPGEVGLLYILDRLSCVGPGQGLRRRMEMGKSMDKRKRLIRGAAVFVVWAAIVVAVRVLKRKRRPRISYGPMHERDRMRIDYLTSKIWHSDVTCINMLRFNRASFFRLCEIMRERQLLENTVHLCVEQQVAMFLHTIGHNVRNRVVSTNFGRSFSTTSIYFRQVLHAIGELRNEYIRPPSSETPEKIAGNPRFDPYFKDCIGAIDGTHVRAYVVKDVEDSFRGRKPFPTQNVMAAVDFDLRFTYVLAGWEGTAHDANVLADALGRERGLQVPEGKYYLVDAGYGAKPGFIPPFCNVRYHLNEWGNNPVQNAEELFNLRHSSLRIAVERAFGSLKRRFKILDDAKPFFPFPVQVDIVVACCVLHNYALSQGIDEFILPEVTWTAQPIRSQTQQAKMDNFESTDASGSNTQGATSLVCWTNSMSTMMLGFLADLVASGKRTSSGMRWMN
nr:uncharacterized protein LOC127322024 [Lolium perenne]